MNLKGTWLTFHLVYVFFYGIGIQIEYHDILSQRHLRDQLWRPD
jgi:hypothetical protein